ncbi:hypothetical protein SDC9_137329 [bioreactor metagenome]|uniref:Uncharacterized protein n=1 Tax=bioreactor metagenome TaxID=1076179 RepID=A0A645DNV6_9ZZZZ
MYLCDQQEQKQADKDCTQQREILVLPERNIPSGCKDGRHKGKAKKQNHKNGHDQMAGMVLQVKKPVFKGCFPKVKNTGHPRPPLR